MYKEITTFEKAAFLKTIFLFIHRYTNRVDTVKMKILLWLKYVFLIKYNCGLPQTDDNLCDSCFLTLYKFIKFLISLEIF